jgi:hypothetical protein
MNLNGIFIDDSGNPGAKSPSKFLPESRKSWCAVVIPSKISDGVSTAMSIFINGVKKDYNVPELHFTDIYSGRGSWKSVSVEDRIKVFDIMGSLCISFNLPIFYQTWGKEFKNDHSVYFELLKKIDMEFWDFQKIDHFGLFLLLVRLKEGLKDLRSVNNDFNGSFHVYVDEGIAKAGNSFQIPCKQDGVFEKMVNFVSSENNVGIQIADFAAFIISRSQWIGMKKKGGTMFSKADKHILSINAKLNHWTLEFMKVTDSTFSKEGLEFLMMRDRQKKGLRTIPK